MHRLTFKKYRDKYREKINSLGPKLFFITRVVARYVECNNDNVTSGASPRYCVSAVVVVSRL